MTTPPKPPPPVATELARVLDPGPQRASGLTRRLATVLAVNADFTVDVIWPTGGTVANLPVATEAMPQVGDVVHLLGVGDAVKDYVVTAAAMRPVPQVGRGIIARTSTATDAVAVGGPAVFTVGEMTTPAAQFWAGRLYRSIFSFALAGTSSDFVTIRLYQDGTVLKWTETNIATPTIGFGTVTINRTVEFTMPDGSHQMKITVDPNASSHRFFANGNAFHTVEDPGPDSW